MEQTTQPIPYSLTGLNPYRWIRWWYALAAPHTPPGAEGLPLKNRELLRQGKLSSLAILFELIILATVLMRSLQAMNQVPIESLVVVLVATTLLLISAFLNRNGKLLLAGSLAMISLEISQIYTIVLAQPQGLTIQTVSLIFIFVQPLMMSILLLPTWGVVLTTVVNIAITLIIFNVFPQSPAFHTIMQDPLLSGLFTSVPILTQVICALVCGLVTSSLRESLMRADRAEEINKLHHVLAEQASQELLAKNQLEEGISEITAVLTRLGNGDAQARIHLEQGHPLWAVAANINNMIGRFVHLRQQDQYITQIAAGVRGVRLALQTAKMAHKPMILPRTESEVDQLVAELRAHDDDWKIRKNYDSTQFEDISTPTPRSTSSSLNSNPSINKPTNNTPFSF